MKFFKEYCIYCIWNGGKPFILKTYSSFEQAKIDLYDMVSLEEERNRPYFVDNDFFCNKYNIGVRGKYFCIQEREITDWRKCEYNLKKNSNNLNLFNLYKNIY